MVENKKVIKPRAWLASVLATLLLTAIPAQAYDETLWADSQTPAIRVAIKAKQEVVISSRTDGVIKRLGVGDGDRFQQGDILLELDCGVLEAQVLRSQAQAKRQNLILESYQRLSALNSKSALEVAVSEAEAAAAEAEALAMEKMLAQCQVKAPFSGLVGDMAVKENQFVATGQPLMEILDDSLLRLEFIVPSHWLAWLKPGFEFNLSIDETGATKKAVVTHLGGRVDPVSQSIKAYAKLEGDQKGLVPGMSGTADIQEPRVSP